MKKIEKIVYEAFDGKVFSSEESCLKYEEQIKGIKFFKVKAGSDLAEGSYSCMHPYYIVDAYCDRKSWIDGAVNVICNEVCGSQYQFVGGVRRAGNAIPVWRPINYEEEIKFPIKVIGGITEKGDVFATQGGKELWNLSEVVEYLNEHY